MVVNIDLLLYFDIKKVVHVLSLMFRGRPSGTESETEEEGSRSGHLNYDSHSIPHLHQ